MPVIVTCFLFWLSATVLETTVFTLSSWFHPNLLLLVSTMFCLHWRGSETYFLALLLGLTADCFSSIPFGIYGLSFYILSFLSRWYGIKMFQGTSPVFAMYIGITTFLMNCLVYLFLSVFFTNNEFIFKWIFNLVINQVIPTMVLAIPSFIILRKIESVYKIRLAERKF